MYISQIFLDLVSQKVNGMDIGRIHLINGINMKKDEKYDLEIGEEGLSYDLLDRSFNESTQAFILKAGIKPGMRVLDVGCGGGVMTAWLAKQVGPKGHVTAIDNSPEQLNFAKQSLLKQKITNVDFQVMSAYDIGKLNQKFDLIYCRFVLHHVHSPRKTIKLFYDNLNSKGIYVGEEGMIGSAFAYPPSFAWQGYTPKLVSPDEEVDGQGREGDFGMKLFYFTRAAGFMVSDCHLVRPVLWKKEDKQGLLENLKVFKKTNLEQGTTEAEWQKKYDETVRLVRDDNQVIGFYGSCQIAGHKLD